MLKRIVAAGALVVLVDGAVAADPVLFRCTVQDEARLSRDGLLSKDDADWFKGYEFTVDLTTGAVGFVNGTPDRWRIVQTSGYQIDIELAAGAESATTDFIRIRTWSTRPGPAPIIFFRARATRVYSGTCVPQGN